jgi:IclR family transcriptional regulator, acetate operon repressor
MESYSIAWNKPVRRQQTITMSKVDTTSVKSLVRALSLLEILAQSGTESSLGSIAQAAKMPPSTAHRLLHSLQRMGYVVQNSTTSDYGLGDNLILLGREAERQRDVRAIARPWLERLARQTLETVNLTALVDEGVVQLDQIDSPNMLKVTWDSGQRFPIYASASGKVFLAYLPDTERERILKASKFRAFTKRTIVDPRKMNAELRMVRERGYAMDDAEREEGVRCIAAPIFDAKGSVIAAVSISGPSLRMSVARLHELSSLIVETTRVVSSSLGFKISY